ncbi:MAG: flippase-like domain-containing protein [Magnetococcales bacterium]|nr:flippase-like domain-containing protein [Magnetococcales bacterium]
MDNDKESAADTTRLSDPVTGSGSGLKNILGFVIKAAISIGLIAWLFPANDLEKTGEQLGSADPLFLLAAFVTALFCIFLVVFRWMAVLETMKVSVSYLYGLQLVLIGIFFNQALPSTVGGDAVRAWRLYRDGYPGGLSVRSVVMDRIIALIGLTLLVILCLPLLFFQLGNTLSFWMILALILAAAVAVVILLMLKRLPERFRGNRIVRGFITLSSDAWAILRHDRAARVTLGISMFVHASNPFVVYCLALAVGVDVSYLACLVLVPPVVLVSVVPISLAGWGVREGAMIAAFGFIGVPAQEAFVLSVGFGLVILATGLPGGPVWLFTRRKGGRAEMEKKNRALS